MADYEVRFNTSAEKDLASIIGCTAAILKEPVNAERLFQTMKNEIGTLRYAPEKHPVVREVPYTMLGLRKMPVEDYNVFYVVSETEKTVLILRVLFDRVEWKFLFREN